MSFAMIAALATSLSCGQPVCVHAVRAAALHDDAAADGMDTAKSWLGLVDTQHWAESWTQASPLFQAGIAKDSWVAQVKSARQPLGALRSRTFESENERTSLPGVPDGRYRIIEFGTDFANRAGAIETITLAYTGGVWKVAGYFIR